MSKDKDNSSQDTAPEKEKQRTRQFLDREQQIFEYITDLETTSLQRKDIASAVGLKLRQVYEYLTPEFWQKCLDARREKYAKYSVRVDVSLINEASSGNVHAIKLFYEKFENLEKKIKFSGNLEVTDLKRMTKEELMKAAGLTGDEK